MIRVWSDGNTSGVLDRHGQRGSAFVYDTAAPKERAISVTMPVRLPSWDQQFGLLPIFEMNLPEGALRERLVRRFAKATGTFDDIDLLAVVGRTQIGRLRYSGIDEDLQEEVPFQSIDDILKARRDGDLFTYLLEQYAPHSGLSGVQPKVMIRGVANKASDPKLRKSPSILSATHIVKMWDEDEFPELAANEYFCLTAAKELGLTVPHFELSDDGGAIVIERFDRIDEGYLGFEDFCVLNGLGTADKYKGGYETRLFKRIREFLEPADAPQALETAYKLFALNCAIRNGDAHLKNFGLTYPGIDAPLSLAPVYDLVTTWAYIPKDPMALTLGGSTKWPNRKQLVQLAQTRCQLMPRRAEQHLEAAADALSTTSLELRQYFKGRDHEIGERMLSAWEDGIKESLGLSGGLHVVKKVAPRRKLKLANSDGRLLEHLRQNDGNIISTIRQLAADLDMPQSTLSTSLKRLVERGFIERNGKDIALAKRAV